MDVNKKGYFCEWRRPGTDERRVVVNISWPQRYEFEFTASMTRDQMVLAIMGNELYRLIVSYVPQGKLDEVETVSREVRGVPLGDLANTVEEMLRDPCKQLDREDEESAVQANLEEF